MNETQFENELTKELAKHSGAAMGMITSLLKIIPETAERLNFEIFPNQDGDGFFSIRANVDGPNLSTINRAVAPHAGIFDPTYTETGIVPYIPLIDPFSSEFMANDVIVDCSARWLNKIWESIDEKSVSIPVLIIGHDGYGTITPVKLV